MQQEVEITISRGAALVSGLLSTMLGDDEGEGGEVREDEVIPIMDVRAPILKKVWPSRGAAAPPRLV